MLKSRCRRCVEVLDKTLTSCRLCPPSSDVYLAEQESLLVALLTKLWTDCDEILWRGLGWYKDHDQSSENLCSLSAWNMMRVCNCTFCRPCTICHRQQIVPTLAAHFVAPCTIWRLATKCAAVVHTVLRWQNVPCKSAYFVVPHRMDLKHSHWYLFAKYEGSNLLHHMVYIYYIHYVSPLARICVVLTMLWVIFVTRFHMVDQY